ncbi:Hypothetical_protein [Hexamita inflata]|uniref:Hypothetical_protein n=1 Tax=Hexamita inflata TaxID=28002 RepID=A0AA86QFB1_9EUKA|nr:Hypothetical protein HINF_LOCUS45275 [Hexamita inflata]
MYVADNDELQLPIGKNFQGRCIPAQFGACQDMIASIISGSVPTMTLTIGGQTETITVSKFLFNGLIDNITVAQNFTNITYTINANTARSGVFQPYCYAVPNDQLTQVPTKYTLSPQTYVFNVGTNVLTEICEVCNPLFIYYCDIQLDNELYLDVQDTQLNRNQHPNSLSIQIPLIIFISLVFIFIGYLIIKQYIKKRFVYRNKPGKQNIRKFEPTTKVQKKNLSTTFGQNSLPILEQVIPTAEPVVTEPELISPIEEEPEPEAPKVEVDDTDKVKKLKERLRKRHALELDTKNVPTAFIRAGIQTMLEADSRSFDRGQGQGLKPIRK